MSFQERKDTFFNYLGLGKKSSFVHEQLDYANLRMAVPITIYTLFASRSMYNRTVLLWHLVSEQVYNSLFVILAVCSVHLLIYSLLYLFLPKFRSHKYAVFSIYLYIIACCLAGQLIAIYDYAIGKQVFIFLPLVAWIFALMLINPVSSSIAALTSFYLIPTYTNTRVVMSNYVDRILMMFAVMLEIISIVRWITQLRSIHAQEKIELMNTQLSEMSMKDELTGLKNRHALRQDYDHYLKKTIVASMCDIDDFKYYNDTYGHDAGDLILKHMGKMLARHFGSDNVYRFGGDEFLIIEQDWTKEAFEEAMKLWRLDFRSFDYEGKSLHLGSTCGYCYGTTQEEEDLRLMISLADQKLYEGKMGQKGTISGCAYEEGKPLLSEEAASKDSLRPGQFDTVTHLPNLTYFRAKAPMSIDIISSSQGIPVMVYFNITNFGGYNRRYGYGSGDRMLKKIGEILTNTFRDDLVCRFSEDHFALITKKEGLEQTVTSLREKMAKISRGFPMDIEAGLYEIREKTDDISYAADCAKQALEYGTKTDNYCWYDDALRETIRKRQYVRDGFNTAMERGWITIVSQPIIRTITMKVAGMEILSRWNDHNLGHIEPDEFIPILEEAGMICDHDLYVLDKAIQKYRENENNDLPVVPMVINLSGRDFDNTELVDRILEITREVDHSLIHFDINAAAFSDADAQVRTALQRLSDAGFELWLDGFGSQNSTLDSLSMFPFAGVKVDIRSLQEVAGGGTQSIILSHIVSMCKDLMISTLALGVESEAEKNFLFDIGFEFIQGFYLSGKEGFEQYADRKKIRPYEIEPLQSRDYYSRISRVNLSRPTQVGKNSRIENLTADIPAAICEKRGDEIRCIRANQAFRDFLPVVGIADVADYEARMNNPKSSIYKGVRDIVGRMKTSDKWETINLSNEDFTCVVSFHKIASDPTEDAISVIGTVLDLSSLQKLKK
ncbi:MAG: EAL domain-containing protein [Solobacterium sp.]|nr:EAL domain-containing protein [Solobacterium sp.]